MVSLSLDPVRPARGGIGLVGAGMGKPGGAFEVASTGSPECWQKKTPVMYYGG